MIILNEKKKNVIPILKIVFQKKNYGLNYVIKKKKINTSMSQL